jgi:hypothetical protein
MKAASITNLKDASAADKEQARADKELEEEKKSRCQADEN